MGPDDTRLEHLSELPTSDCDIPTYNNLGTYHIIYYLCNHLQYNYHLILYCIPLTPPLGRRGGQPCKFSDQLYLAKLSPIFISFDYALKSVIYLLMSTLNIISYNVNSIRSNDKANPFSLEVQRLNPDIMTIIDTRLNKEAETYLINLLPDYRVISNFTGHQSRGVSIIFKKSFNFEILDVDKDNSGNILLAKLRFNMFDFVIGAIYGPNYDNPMFYEELFDKAFGLGCDSIFLLGDFNMTLNFNMDTRRYVDHRNINATEKMKDLLEDYSMTDIWRKMHSRKRQFTWMVPNSNPPQMARLDYGFATPNISNNIKHSEILEIAWSDHAPIKFSFDYHRIKSSKNYWICPSHLFKRQEYIDLIIDKIKETYGLYLKTLTNDNFLLHCTAEERIEFFNKNIEGIEDCELSIDNSQFFVILVNALRNASIDYASMIRTREQDVLQKITKTTQPNC